MAPIPPAGRLLSLGMDIDLSDAGDILAVVRAGRGQMDRGRVGAGKTVREALWWWWEQPRLPRPLLRGKYPLSYPWSPDAQKLLARHMASGVPVSSFRGVVIEHLIPAERFFSEALRRSHELDAPGMLGLLENHGRTAIVTAAEDAKLTKSGVASRMPAAWDGVDEWARLRHAGLPIYEFGPVEQVSEGLVSANPSEPKGESQPPSEERSTA